MQIEPLFSCDGCGLPRGPLSPIPGEGGPRHLCPACFHAYIAGEVSAMEQRVGIKGGESMDDETRREALEYQRQAQADYARMTAGIPRTPEAAAMEATPDPVTHYPDGQPRDYVTLEIRAEDYRTLSQLMETWRCARENVVGVLCRAVRMQVWPLGDVLTNHPEFQSWVERIVLAEQAPLQNVFRRATPEEQAAMDEALPRRGRRSLEPTPKDAPRGQARHRCHECGRALDQWGGYYCSFCLDKMSPEERRQYALAEEAAEEERNA